MIAVITPYGVKLEFAGADNFYSENYGRSFAIVNERGEKLAYVPSTFIIFNPSNVKVSFIKQEET